MSNYKKEYWVLDSVPYWNDPKLPTEVHNAIDELASDSKWGNNAFHNFSVEDFKDTFEDCDYALTLFNFLKSHGANDKDDVLIHFWW